MPSKSANQLWRESGTSLPFKDWIQREKDKGVEIKNAKLSDILEEELMLNASGLEEENSATPPKKSLLPTWSIYVGVGVLALAIGYKIYQNKK
jgi:hypothetical protein